MKYIILFNLLPFSLSSFSGWKLWTVSLCSCRASIEPNFHDLYLKFLDKVNSKALNKEIVKATYENCKVFLCHFFFFSPIWGDLIIYMLVII